jgi:drug/metabolite transporter (DMT)-like permease
VRAATKAWLQIHFCVVLWSFTAILGKVITLPALAIVWWRMLLVSAAMLLIAGFWRGLRTISPRHIAIYAGIGVFVALHWLTFYGSIKLSNASVAATCMALTPVFISFVEPILVGRRFELRELLLGLAVLPGIMLVVGGTPDGMRLGIAIGSLSALLVAVFSSLNKKYIEHGAALTVTGIEMAAGALLLTLAAFALPVDTPFVLPRERDVLYLLALAIGCTLLPFTLSLIALRHLSAFTSAIAVNMEPVYSIVLAILLLDEQRELEPSFYLGVVIILVIVFSHPWLARRAPPRSAHGALSREAERERVG